MTRANKHRKKKKNSKFIFIILIFMILFVSGIIYFKLKGNVTGASSPVSTSTNNTASENNTAGTDNSAANAANTSENSSNAANTANKSNTSNKTGNNVNSAVSNTSANTAANTAANATQTDTSNADSNGNAVSVAKAKSILEAKINKSDQKLSVSYDHLQTRDNQKYYVFRASESGGDSQSSNTSGWYYVNVNSGEAYNWDLIEDKLDLIK